MEGPKEDESYPLSPYGAPQDYVSPQSPLPPVRNAPYPQHIDDSEDYLEGSDGDEKEEDLVGVGGEYYDEPRAGAELNCGENKANGVIHLNGDEDNDDDDDDMDEENADSDDEDGNDHDGHPRIIENVSPPRHPKKRKLKSLLSSYEFAPRVAAPTPVAVLKPKSSFGKRSSHPDWTEHESFILLDAWGDKFLQRGRKSLRSEEWQEVSERVSRESIVEKNGTQCRNRLDTLKKKYKKEKAKIEGTRGGVVSSKWVYYKKMDFLMSSTPQQPGNVSSVVDSGDYIFIRPSVNANNDNGLEGMKSSPGRSESPECDDDSDLLPPKKSKAGTDKSGGGSCKLLADSIFKFSEIYEKIENKKRQQMLELEKMRMDFHRDLEMQKRQILDRARIEIAKVWQGDSEENDASAENISG